MKILAIDQSSHTCSAAILEDEDVIATRSWPNNHSKTQDLFRIIPELNKEASTQLGEIELFCCGLGPGSFAGIRISLSASNAFALPGKKPVTGISSPEAMAFGANKKGTIAVIGDARRNKLWIALYNTSKNTISTIIEPSLINNTELTNKLTNCDYVISDDWSRIDNNIKYPEILKEHTTPSANSIGVLCFRRWQQDHVQSITDVTPIYLHPPVFIKAKTI